VRLLNARAIARFVGRSWVSCFVLYWSFVNDDIMTLPSCDVITHGRPRDVELVGRRRRPARRRTCCCRRCFSSSPPESVDSAALYEYSYAQRTGGGRETTDKHLPRSPRCLISDHAAMPPLLPPPPSSRDRQSTCADPPPLSEDLAWTRLGGVDHEVYVERCPHAAVHCPSTSARHILVPAATTTLGDVGPALSAVQYYKRNQLVTTDNEQSVPTSLSTAAELQLCRPVDCHQDAVMDTMS